MIPRAIMRALGLLRCRQDETETIRCQCVDGDGRTSSLDVHVMECSGCGHTYEHVWGGYEFCPHCGVRTTE